MNQEIGEHGSFQNESSLDFALHMLKHQKSWLYNLSYLVRCMLIDHVFTDGNKRTAYVLIRATLEDKGLEGDKQKLYLTVLTIAKKNIRDVHVIMRLIKNGILVRES